MPNTIINLFQSGAALDSRGVVLLAVAFAVGSLLFIPRTMMCIAAGLVCGWSAAPIALLGLTIGAILAFLLARYALRSRFIGLVAARPTARAILEAIDAEGWRLVGLIRLGGPLPFAAQSYLCGLTGIPLRAYASATFVFAAPQVVLYVWLGGLGQVSLQDGAHPVWTPVLVVLAAVTTATALVLVSKRARVALRTTALSRPGALAQSRYPSRFQRMCGRVVRASGPDQLGR